MGVMEADLDDLRVRDALRRLVTAYSRAVDRRNFPLLRSLYHDDALERHGGMFGGGPDAYVAFVETALSAYEATAHYVVNMSFVVDGDHAEGEVHKINYHRKPGPDAHEIITGSRSLDRYRRGATGWGFVERTVVLDWAVRRPVDPAAYTDFAASSPPGRAGPDDLSYRLALLAGRPG